MFTETELPIKYYVSPHHSRNLTTDEKKLFEDFKMVDELKFLPIFLRVNQMGQTDHFLKVIKRNTQYL